MVQGAVDAEPPRGLHDQQTTAKVQRWVIRACPKREAERSSAPTSSSAAFLIRHVPSLLTVLKYSSGKTNSPAAICRSTGDRSWNGKMPPKLWVVRVRTHAQAKASITAGQWTRRVRAVVRSQLGCAYQA